MTDKRTTLDLCCLLLQRYLYVLCRVHGTRGLFWGYSELCLSVCLSVPYNPTNPSGQTSASVRIKKKSLSCALAASVRGSRVDFTTTLTCVLSRSNGVKSTYINPTTTMRASRQVSKCVCYVKMWTVYIRRALESRPELGPCPCSQPCRVLGPSLGRPWPLACRCGLQALRPQAPKGSQAKGLPEG